MNRNDCDPVRMTLTEAQGCSCCAGRPAVHRGGGTVTDPVCGMAVSPDESTPNTDYAGQLYYFCAPACRRTFERDSEAYALDAEPNGPAERPARRGTQPCRPSPCPGSTERRPPASP